jgi:hypothetical protein
VCQVPTIPFGLPSLQGEFHVFWLHSPTFGCETHKSFSHSTKAKFRRLKRPTFYGYRNTLSRLFLLPLRFRLWERCGRKKYLGSLTMTCPKEQSVLLDKIYNVLLTSSLSEDDTVLVDRDALAELMHKLLVSVLLQVHPVLVKVSSLIEAVMVIAVMTPEGHVRRASFVTGEGAHWQRTLLSIFVHCAMLGGFDKPYLLPTKPLDEIDILSTAEDGLDGNETADEEGEIISARISQDDADELEEQCVDLALTMAAEMAVPENEGNARRKKVPAGFVAFPSVATAASTATQLPPIPIPIEEDDTSVTMAHPDEDPILK